MVDSEVATKAPESDAQESVVAGDTPAQTGPSMGVCNSFRLKSDLTNRASRSTAYPTDQLVSH